MMMANFTISAFYLQIDKHYIICRSSSDMGYASGPMNLNRGGPVGVPMGGPVGPAINVEHQRSLSTTSRQSYDDNASLDSLSLQQQHRPSMSASSGTLPIAAPVAVGGIAPTPGGVPVVPPCSPGGLSSSSEHQQQQMMLQQQQQQEPVDPEREEEERRRKVQLYVFVIRCIAYPFNAKQPTDMIRRQTKVTPKQLQSLKDRFQVSVLFVILIVT